MVINVLDWGAKPGGDLCGGTGNQGGGDTGVETEERHGGNLCRRAGHRGEDLYGGMGDRDGGDLCRGAGDRGKEDLSGGMGDRDGDLCGGTGDRENSINRSCYNNCLRTYLRSFKVSRSLRTAATCMHLCNCRPLNHF